MYVPIMKNRSVEVSVLQILSELNVFDDNIIPLIEVIQEKTRSNNKSTFLQDLQELLNDCPAMSVMVDFYKSTKLRYTTDTIREYVTMSVRDRDFPIKQISQLIQCRDQVIPVISYLPDNSSLERISYEHDQLRTMFSRIAFRIRIQEFNSVFTHVESIIRSNDFIVLDIESASPSNSVFRRVYKRISDSRDKYNFTSIIVRSHRPDELANNAMDDGEPIAKIDNSLLEIYSSERMGFSGFGDYASIASSLPSTGGAISPVGIYYSFDNNFFIAYRGRAPRLSEFPEYIAPRIIKSDFWNEYSDKHHNN